MSASNPVEQSQPEARKPLGVGSRNSATHPVAYMPQLDGLRAFAILLVLLNRWLPSTLPERVPFGVAGVFIFFVISGFLITRILLESKSAPLGHALKAFYVRRVLRIFPAYYLVVGAFTVLGIEVMRETAAWNLTYTTNFYIFLHGIWPTWASHFWSLAIEEQFYLVWPIVLLLMPKRALPWMLMALIIASPITRFALVLNGFNTAQITALPICALDFLGIGALLAVYWDSPKINRLRPWMGPAALAALAVWGTACFFGKHDFNPAVFAVQASVVPFIGVYLVARSAEGFSGTIGSVLQWAPIVYIGKISYGIYLLYGFMTLLRARIYQVLGIDWLDNAYLNLVVNLVMNVTLAMLMFELFERHVLKLKRFITYKKPSKASSPATNAGAEPAPMKPFDVPAKLQVREVVE